MRDNSATISLGPGPGDKKQDDPDAPPVLDEGYGAARDDAGLAAGFAPRPPLFGVEDVIVGAGFLSPKRLAADALAVGVFRIDRES
jgi:hypothetical protein